jgi:hypothetical protein
MIIVDVNKGMIRIRKREVRAMTRGSKYLSLPYDEAASSSETSVNICQTTRRNIP